MNWFGRVLSTLSRTKAVEVPNRLLVTELDPPFPQKDIPGIRRRVFVVRAADPARPLPRLSADDGIPRLHDPYPVKVEGRTLYAKRVRTEPGPTEGTYYFVVDYTFEQLKLSERESGPHAV